MKKVDLGQTIGILANIGVIAGIVFLALEISQNNELLRAAADTNYLQGRLEERRRIRFDPEFAEFVVREGNGQLEGPVDMARAYAGVEITILTLQWEYGQLVDGNLVESRDELIARWRRDFERAITTPDHFYQSVWPAFRGGLRPEFVEFWEQEIVAFYQ